MNIILDDKKVIVNKIHDNLDSLLKSLNLTEKDGIAVSVNNEIIPFFNHDKFVLLHDDKIEIIYATQGG